jgi:hypothetical protein
MLSQYFISFATTSRLNMNIVCHVLSALDLSNHRIQILAELHLHVISFGLFNQAIRTLSHHCGSGLSLTIGRNCDGISKRAQKMGVQILLAHNTILNSPARVPCTPYICQSSPLQNPE